MTCWRRLAEWQHAGVWQKIHEPLLARLDAAAQIDWSRAVVDSSSIRAVGKAMLAAPTLQIVRNPAANTVS